MILGRKATLSVVYAERYVLPLVFFCLAWIDLHKLWVNGPEQNGTENLMLAGIARHVLYSQMQIYVGFLLLLGRCTAVPPKNLKDFLVPLIATFYYFSYSAVPWLPAPLRESLSPANLQTLFAAIGLFLNLLGISIAIWSAVSLGRAFGVFIEVKNVVLDGAYRWVRHPMYLGYFCLLTGVVFVNFSIAFFILVPINIVLLLYRARLEEERLCEYSPQYSEYQKHTGFIFPKFRQLWMG